MLKKYQKVYDTQLYIQYMFWFYSDNTLVWRNIPGIDQFK